MLTVINRSMGCLAQQLAVHAVIGKAGHRSVRQGPHIPGVRKLSIVLGKGTMYLATH